MRVTSEIVGTPVRRVVMELPEERALALSRAINEHIEWCDTEAENELMELHSALGEDWRSAEQAAAQKAEGEA